MSQPSESEPSAAQRIRDAATAMRSHRSRPCLLYVSRQVAHSDVLAMREACETLETDVLDVVISSPGGDLEAAYLVARDLRRRAKHLCVYVPFRAKSAASLICLAADELVLGSLGELGPLDQQYDEKMAADFPLNTSRLLLQTALTELQDQAVSCYDAAMQRILRQSGMRPFEACSKAAEFTGNLYGPLLARLDPARLAESARGLALGRAYASRLLRRYRPALPEADRDRQLDRLVRGYPAHSFVVDREEAAELGLPVRPPDPMEEALLERLAYALIEFDTEQDLIALAGPPPKAVAAAPKVNRRLPRKVKSAPFSSRRRQRKVGQEDTVK